jgi:hypothetical protein
MAAGEPSFEELESGRVYREIELDCEGEAMAFVHNLLDYIDGARTAGKAWGSYTIRLNYRGKGVDSVDITDQHSIKFKPKSG